MFIEDRAYHERKKLGRRLKWLWLGWIAVALISLWMLSGCQTSPEPLPTNIAPTKVIYVQVHVPALLLQPNYVYVEPKTYGQAVDGYLEALGALGECNADKLKIKEWNDVKAD